MTVEIYNPLKLITEPSALSALRDFLFFVSLDHHKRDLNYQVFSFSLNRESSTLQTAAVSMILEK